MTITNEPKQVECSSALLGSPSGKRTPLEITDCVIRSAYLAGATHIEIEAKGYSVTYEFDGLGVDVESLFRIWHGDIRANIPVNYAKAFGYELLYACRLCSRISITSNGLRRTIKCDGVTADQLVSTSTDKTTITLEGVESGFAYTGRDQEFFKYFLYAPIRVLLNGVLVPQNIGTQERIECEAIPGIFIDLDVDTAHNGFEISTMGLAFPTSRRASVVYCDVARMAAKNRHEFNSSPNAAKELVEVVFSLVVKSLLMKYQEEMTNQDFLENFFPTLLKYLPPTTFEWNYFPSNLMVNSLDVSATRRNAIYPREEFESSQSPVYIDAPELDGATASADAYALHKYIALKRGLFVLPSVQIPKEHWVNNCAISLRNASASVVATGRVYEVPDWTHHYFRICFCDTLEIQVHGLPDNQVETVSVGDWVLYNEPLRHGGLKSLGYSNEMCLPVLYVNRYCVDFPPELLQWETLVREDGAALIPSLKSVVESLLKMDAI